MGNLYEKGEVGWANIGNDKKRKKKEKTLKKKNLGKSNKHIEMKYFRRRNILLDGAMKRLNENWNKN